MSADLSQPWTPIFLTVIKREEGNKEGEEGGKEGGSDPGSGGREGGRKGAEEKRGGRGGV